MRSVQKLNILDLLNRPINDGKGTVKTINDISLALNLDANTASQETVDYLQGIKPSSNDGRYTLDEVKDVENVAELVDTLETRFLQDRFDKIRYANALQTNLKARISEIEDKAKADELRAKYDELFK